MQIIHNIGGNPPSSTPIYERLFGFIDENLLDFKPLSKKDDGSTANSEDDITEDLVDYLDSKQESLLLDKSMAFKFTNQSKQGNKKTDIGVRLGRNYIEDNRPLFCWIEAKRLPTPNGGVNRDEREYVIVSDEKIGSVHILLI
jgi:hypothetical protein